MKHLFLIALYVCSARTLTGKYFFATNEIKEVAKAEALRACQVKSFNRCYPTGCKVSK